ncbi:MAG: HAMP domain-containing histidine kinase [Sulfurimonas sp.]|nr:HAMP domain-containing histidine kinase [Sulfurimonas sp.]
MLKHAVFLTVLFAYIVTIVSVSAVFLEFYKLNKQRYIDNIFSKHEIITQIYREYQQKKTSKILLEANLAVYKSIIKEEKIQQLLILKEAKLLREKDFQRVDESISLDAKGLYAQKVVRDFRISMLEWHKKIYFYIKSPIGSVLIEDEELKPYSHFSLAYTYSTIMLIISISFLLILQRLRPLILLRRKIARFGDGDLNISFKTSGSDEIALVSNELESARQKIKTILDSRTLFLRNIMHELKTPIAKGTIATQMLNTEKQRDRFSSIFGRLESLVSEFALIEEVTSVGNKNDFKEYRLVDIIDGAIDMAMLEKISVTLDIDESTKLFVNYRLYVTAIKNMIDNGIKYSTDAHINIRSINNELCFESKGKCLSKPLHYYIEPFTKDNPSKNSFGLGLYLVDSILKVHDQVLAHEYISGQNRFIFT